MQLFLVLRGESLSNMQAFKLILLIVYLLLEVHGVGNEFRVERDAARTMSKLLIGEQIPPRNMYAKT